LIFALFSNARMSVIRIWTRFSTFELQTEWFFYSAPGPFPAR